MTAARQHYEFGLSPCRNGLLDDLALGTKKPRNTETKHKRAKEELSRSSRPLLDFSTPVQLLSPEEVRSSRAAICGTNFGVSKIRTARKTWDV